MMVFDIKKHTFLCIFYKQYVTVQKPMAAFASMYYDISLCPN